jgi:hypothetical protein
MARTPTVERLLGHLFGDGAADPLAEEIGEWMSASTRFRAFLEDHRDKARKKLRGATDPDARRDVLAELRVASRLVADRRIGLAWEAYGSTEGGPDFTVSYRSRRSFNLEVTRLRRADAAMAHGGPMLAKLRQLPPSVPNGLLIVVDDGPRLDPLMLARSLRARADAKDEAFFIQRGFKGSREFYDRFLRLGAVIVWSDTEEAAVVWVNRSARIPVPSAALQAIAAALGT